MQTRLSKKRVNESSSLVTDNKKPFKQSNDQSSNSISNNFISESEFSRLQNQGGNAIMSIITQYLTDVDMLMIFKPSCGSRQLAPSFRYELKTRVDSKQYLVLGHKRQFHPSSDDVIVRKLMYNSPCFIDDDIVDLKVVGRYYPKQLPKNLRIMNELEASGPIDMNYPPSLEVLLSHKSAAPSSNLPNLKQLQVKTFQIPNAPIQRIEISIDEDISMIDFQDPIKMAYPNLIELHCVNMIDPLPETVERLTIESNLNTKLLPLTNKLKYLRCRMNQDISSLPQGIETLDLTSNGVSISKDQACLSSCVNVTFRGFVMNMLPRMPSLVELTLDACKFTGISDYSAGISHLNRCSSNLLSLHVYSMDLHQLTVMKDVKGIKSLTLKYCTHLKHLTFFVDLEELTVDEFSDDLNTMFLPRTLNNLYWKGQKYERSADGKWNHNGLTVSLNLKDLWLNNSKSRIWKHSLIAAKERNRSLKRQ